MLNIIVCDDDSCFLNRLVEKITAYFRQKEIPFQIASYCSGEALLCKNEENRFEIAFLDISMETFDGIETAYRRILIWIGSFLKELLYKNNSGDIIVLLIIIICLSEFSVLYLLLAARAELERGRIKAAAVQTQMQLGIYKSKQDLYTEQSKRIHDHKNQLLAICHMLEQNQVPQALKYTRKLTGYMVKELDPIYTNHPIADGILNMKKQEAYDKKNISL